MKEIGPEILGAGADTVLEVDGLILEKPKDADEARRMLQNLSNRDHRVSTGVALALPGQESATDAESSAEIVSFVTTTVVSFSELSNDIIDAYVATSEPFDKAGGYGIQGKAASFVEKVSGCYFNVVGLPLNALSRALLDLINGKKL